MTPMGHLGGSLIIVYAVSADPVAFRSRVILVVGLLYVAAFVLLSLCPVSLSLGCLGGSFFLRWLLVALFLSFLVGPIAISFLISFASQFIANILSG